MDVFLFLVSIKVKVENKNSYFLFLKKKDTALKSIKKLESIQFYYLTGIFKKFVRNFKKFVFLRDYIRKILICGFFKLSIAKILVGKALIAF